MTKTESHYAFLQLSPSASEDAIRAAVTQHMKQANKLALTEPAQSYELRERLRQIKEDLLAGTEARKAYDDAQRGQGKQGGKPQTQAKTTTAPTHAAQAARAVPQTGLEQAAARLESTMREFGEEEERIKTRLRTPGGSEAELNKLLQTADAQIADVIRLEGVVCEVLERHGRAALLKLPIPPRPAAPPDADPSRELGACLSTVDTTQRRLTARIPNPFMSVAARWLLLGGVGIVWVIAIAATVAVPLANTIAVITGLCVLGLLGVLQYEWRRRSRGDARKLAQAAADARFWHALVTQEVAEKRAEGRAARPQLEAALQPLATKRREAIAAFERSTETIAGELGPGCAAWDHSLWRTWSPPESIGPAIRLGKTTLRFDDLSARMPLHVRFPGPVGILIEAPGSARGLALLALQSVVLRILAICPPGMLRLHLADPAGLGQTVSPFLRLADYDDSLILGGVAVASAHLERMLTDVGQHIRQTTRLCTEAACASIEQYNNHTPSHHVAYHLVVLAGIPPLGPTALSHLEQIILRGPACGVYSTIVADHDQLTKWAQADPRIEERLTRVRWDEQRFVVQMGQIGPTGAVLDTPPPYALFNRIIETIGQATMAEQTA